MIYSQAIRPLQDRQSHTPAAGILQALGIVAATTSGGVKKGRPFYEFFISVSFTCVAYKMIHFVRVGHLC